MRQLYLILMVFLSISCDGSDNKDREKKDDFTHEILISNRSANAVSLYQLDGAFSGHLVQPGSGGLGSTQDIVIADDDHMLVSGYTNSTTTAIKKFHKFTGQFIRDFSFNYTLNAPTKMTLGPDSNLYVSQWGNGERVVKFDYKTGVYTGLATLVDFGQEMGHAWDSDTILYVVSFDLKRVGKFDQSGNKLNFEVETNRISGPVNCWIENNHLFVVDWQSGRVVQFNKNTGAFIQNFITGLTNPEGFAVGPDGALYICDWTTNKINKYDANTGQFLSTFVNGTGLNSPNGITFRRKL